MYKFWNSPLCAVRNVECLSALQVNGQDDAVTCNGTELAMVRRSGEKPCRFDPIAFGDCARYPFGFVATNLNPCIILKMNKIFDFVPEPLIPQDVDKIDLPERVSFLVLRH
jgi:Sodium / potassium ATPase beta chain